MTASLRRHRKTGVRFALRLVIYSFIYFFPFFFFIGESITSLRGEKCTCVCMCVGKLRLIKADVCEITGVHTKHVRHRMWSGCEGCLGPGGRVPCHSWRATVFVTFSLCFKSLFFHSSVFFLIVKYLIFLVLNLLYVTIKPLLNCFCWSNKLYFLIILSKSWPVV